MKKLGLIGGMSWQSTVLYYQHLNRMVQAQLGGSHSAYLLLESVDFAVVEDLQKQDDWRQLGQLMAQAAANLQTAGAELILICSNTMHQSIDLMQAAIDIPILHIADATGRHIHQSGLQKVGLLGTRYTMQRDFLKARLNQQFGLEVLIPSAAHMEEVHRIIFEELIFGEVRPESQAIYLQVIEDLKSAGCEAVIMGCTEITLLLAGCDTAIPAFDSTEIHAQAAIAWALSE